MSDSSPDFFDLIASLRERSEAFCVATIVRTEHATSAKAGAKAVVLADGTLHGHLGGGCVTGAVQRGAQAVLTEGKPRLIRVRPSDQVVERLDLDGVELHKSACPSGGTVDIFIEPMLPAPRLFICGGSPVAVALADLAPHLGYEVFSHALSDDLDKFRGPATAVAGFDLAGQGVSERDFVVVATQGKRDREALAAALATAAGYIAFVGSRRKSAVLAEQLRGQGVPAERLNELSAPAGLDIGAIGPAEIALSILGEIVAHRRRGIKEHSEVKTVIEGGG